MTGGVLARHPGLTCCSPTAAARYWRCAAGCGAPYAVRPEDAPTAPARPTICCAALYYDSLTHDRAVLADLVAFAGAGHVLLGSDRPFDMGADRPADDIAALRLSEARRAADAVR